IGDPALGGRERSCPVVLLHRATRSASTATRGPRTERHRRHPGALCPSEFEHRDGADSSSSAGVLGIAWVTPRLLGVDAVAFSAFQFADADGGIGAVVGQVRGAVALEVGDVTTAAGAVPDSM